MTVLCRKHVFRYRNSLKSGGAFLLTHATIPLLTFTNSVSGWRALLARQKQCKHAVRIRHSAHFSYWLFHRSSSSVSSFKKFFFQSFAVSNKCKSENAWNFLGKGNLPSLAGFAGRPEWLDNSFRECEASCDQSVLCHGLRCPPMMPWKKIESRQRMQAAKVVLHWRTIGETFCTFQPIATSEKTSMPGLLWKLTFV